MKWERDNLIVTVGCMIIAALAVLAFSYKPAPKRKGPLPRKKVDPVNRIKQWFDW